MSALARAESQISDGMSHIYMIKHESDETRAGRGGGGVAVMIVSDSDCVVTTGRPKW